MFFFIEKMMLNWLDIVDDNLQVVVVVKFVDIEFVSQLYFVYVVIWLEGGIDIKSNIIQQWIVVDWFDYDF